MKPCESAHHSPTVVTAPIIDEDQLKLEAFLCKHGLKSLDKHRQRFLTVEDRNNDRYSINPTHFVILPQDPNQKLATSDNKSQWRGSETALGCKLPKGQQSERDAQDSETRRTTMVSDTIYWFSFAVV